MTVRRSPARLAAAVSAVLATPATFVGTGLAAGLLVAPLTWAQETTAQLGGQVSDADGAPVAGAKVTVLHVPTGTATVLTANASGRFSVSGLRVGGPYRVTAESGSLQPDTVDNVFARLGQPVSVALVLQPTAVLSEVVVTASAEREVAVGWSRSYGTEDLNAIASVSRDVKDVIRIDPKAIIDPTNVDAIEIGGTNGRYNSISVDGVRQGDDFGLNNNGYPTTRSPLSFDAIEAVSVKGASFDVKNSGYQGGAINIVTKSGRNDFFGSAFYYKFDDSLAGDKSGNNDLTFDFSEETYGGTFGGPILQDKLFFFLSYEKLDKLAPQDFGPTGSGAAAPIPGVTQAEYDLIRQVAQSVYDYEAGEFQSSLPESDEKILAKLDWQITDAHRATLAYQSTEGPAIVDPNSSISLRRLSSPANNYERFIDLKQYTLQLNSTWNDWLSTELMLGRKEVLTTQIPLGGADFAEMQITTPSGGVVYLGPDEFRHANYLTNDLDQAKLRATGTFGDHTVTAGLELEKLDVYNLFVPRSQGQYTFSSITNFANRQAQSLRYNNAFSNDANDGAGAFAVDQWAFFLQDAWQLTDSLLLQAGLRYDLWSSSDQPLFNQNFENRYGFANTETLDGRDLISPRLGFNWQINERATLYGGVGLFGGGTPNVWFSNSFANDGVTIVEQSYTRPTTGALTPLQDAALNNVDGYDMAPAVLAQQLTLRGDGGVNAVDPGFEVPSSWKANLGFEYEFETGWRTTLDVTYTDVKDGILYQDIRLVQTGTAPDGRPIYGKRAGDTRSFTTQDFLLTNTGDGRGVVTTVDLAKTWKGSYGQFDVYIGYGHQNVDDANPGTSSQASSNWDNVATADPNDPRLATSNYEIKHRYTGDFRWSKAFFGAYDTAISLFVERRVGRTYSYTFAAPRCPSSSDSFCTGRTASTNFGDPRQASRQRQLLYVPLLNDPNVVYDGMTQQQMDAFIDGSGLSKYRGQIAPRNAFKSPWITTADLRLQQELPAFFDDARVTLSFDVENIANLIDNDWGRVEQVSFPGVSPVVDVAIDSQGRYVYRPIRGLTGPRGSSKTLSALPSVWRLQLGIKLEF